MDGREIGNIGGTTADRVYFGSETGHAPAATLRATPLAIDIAALTLRSCSRTLPRAFPSGERRIRSKLRYRNGRNRAARVYIQQKARDG